MQDITHTSGDPYQKTRLLSGGEQTDRAKTSDEKKANDRTHLERPRQAGVRPTQTSGETDRILERFSKALILQTPRSFETETSTSPALFPQAGQTSVARSQWNLDDRSRDNSAAAT